jgi:FG-GAP-like repeat/FG-GAP repeat
MRAPYAEQGVFVQLAKIPRRSRFYECMDIFVHQGWAVVRSIQQLKGNAMRNLLGCLSGLMPKPMRQVTTLGGVAATRQNRWSNIRLSNKWATLCAGTLLWLIGTPGFGAIIDSGPMNQAVPSNGTLAQVLWNRIDLNMVTGETLTVPIANTLGFFDVAISTGSSNTLLFTTGYNNSFVGQTSARALPAGTVIGPSSQFSSEAVSEIGDSGLLPLTQNYGLRFRNDSTGIDNYGYVQVEISNPQDRVVRITRYAYENTGQAIIIPSLSLPTQLTASDPKFARPSTFARGGTCSINGAVTPYRTHTFRLETAQDVNLSAVVADGAEISPPGADTFMVLYGPGRFDPASPCTNAIVSNDDAAGTPQSAITASQLPPGIYTLVLSSFGPSPNALPWTYRIASNVNLIQPITSGLLNFNNSLFNRPEQFAEGQACSVSGQRVHYRTHRFTLAAPQSVTISALAEEGAEIKGAPDADTFMVLYGPGEFNPAQPCNNAIIANDDAAGVSTRSRISTAPLQPGNYTLVFTSFRNTPFGPTSLPWPYTLAANVGLQRSPTDQTPAFDLNADSNTDLLFRNTTTGQISGWLMNGSTATATAGLLPPGAWTITHTADFNNDGKSDLVFRNDDGSVTLWLMNGLSVVSSAGLIGPDPNWRVTYVGDFNGDGKADILWRNTNGAVTLWLMDGMTVTSTASLLGPDPNWQVTHVADFNGDGKADLLWRNTNGSVTQWLMSGTSIANATSLLGPDPSWSVTHTADLNGDGKADLLWRNTNGAVIAWLMNGTAVTSTAGLLGADPHWRITHVGDFNGDGKSDILWRNTNGSVTQWLMFGTSIANATSLLGPDPNWQVTHLGDFNGDGKADLVWRNTTDGSITVWLMNGTAVSSTAGILGAGAWAVVP